MKRISALAHREDGFTLGIVLIATFIATAIATVALAAATKDLNGNKNDYDQKQAYDAAQAGINDYVFHLNNDINYWAKCTNVPTPNAVNQMGSTSRRRFVPGSSTASYAIELIPATGKTSCDTNDPVGSMIEPASSGSMMGTFRIRSTGYSGKEKRSIVAQLKRASFLDYVYFTEYETSDPVTYGDPDTVDAASESCEVWRRDGRPNPDYSLSPPRPYCNIISFISSDNIKGPLHTNDDLMICGTPTFGRSPNDVIEVSAPPPGWQSLNTGCGSAPNFRGTYVTNAPVLRPPPTNAELKTAAQPAYRFDGNMIIFLNGNSMNVYDGTTWTTMAQPSNGVVFVSNDQTKPCAELYSPFTATYFDANNGCGNVYVAADVGGYSQPLTIAAENDIIIYGNLTRSGTANNGILGLVANNFVRVKHEYPQQTLNGCGSNSGEVGLQNLRIDAAIMAIQHSFIVDHYNCGADLGTLTVNGAIAQKYRGPVGTFGGSTRTGYAKDYNYDNRLRYMAPPYFLDPVEAAWHIQRETVDFCATC